MRHRLGWGFHAPPAHHACPARQRDQLSGRGLACRRRLPPKQALAVCQCAHSHLQGPATEASSPTKMWVCKACPTSHAGIRVDAPVAAAGSVPCEGLGAVVPHVGGVGWPPVRLGLAACRRLGASPRLGEGCLIHQGLQVVAVQAQLAQRMQGLHPAGQQVSTQAKVPAGLGLADMLGQKRQSMGRT